MKAAYISYQDTHAFSKLVLDYVNNKPEIKDLYGFRPDLEGFEKAIASHHFSGDRSVLHRVLSEQYAPLITHGSVKSNIDLLLNENTFTVTTGHQLNLFTGPLYFIYKIVSTINLSIELKLKFPQKNFVPVYWMATEDHDFNEINHVKVEGKNISWIEQTNGATGRMNTQSVAAAVAAYQGYLGISKNGKQLASIVKRAYLEHELLADATRYLVNELFQQYGLVIINADHDALKKIFLPIIKQDILEQNSDRNIQITNKILEKEQYPIQVHSRPINFFYLKELLRERIVLVDGIYKVMHTDIQFDAAGIAAEIEAHPERFSPNVVMRPLYQECILPNIAYIGGGAEVAYWMQLKRNFDFYKIEFPIILLRNSALVLDARSAKDLKSLGFDYQDLFLPVAELQKRWVNAHAKEDLCLLSQKKAFQQLFTEIQAQALKIDSTLKASVECVSVKMSKQMDNLEKKFVRAEKRKHKESIQKIENLKKRLFPGGTLQERTTNLAPMYVNYGDDFIASLIENFDPLGGDFTLIIAES